MSCCDVYGNSGGDWVGCIAGMLGLEGNIAENPRFCDPGARNFTLAEDSPCAAENNPLCGQIGALTIGCGAQQSIPGMTAVPLSPVLHALRPNPAGSQAMIVFDLPAPQPIRLEVLDVTGRQLAVLTERIWAAGRNTIRWAGTDDAGRLLPPGVYFVRLAASDVSVTRQVTWIE